MVRLQIFSQLSSTQSIEIFYNNIFLSCLRCKLFHGQIYFDSVFTILDNYGYWDATGTSKQHPSATAYQCSFINHIQPSSNIEIFLIVKVILYVRNPTCMQNLLLFLCVLSRPLVGYHSFLSSPSITFLALRPCQLLKSSVRLGWHKQRDCLCFLDKRIRLCRFEGWF